MGWGQTDKQTYGHRDSMIESAQWADLMKTLSNCDKYMKLGLVFPVLRSLVQNLRRFSNILRNSVIA